MNILPKEPQNKQNRKVYLLLLYTTLTFMSSTSEKEYCILWQLFYLFETKLSYSHWCNLTNIRSHLYKITRLAISK